MGGIVALDGEDADERAVRSVKALSLRLTRGLFVSSEPLYKSAIPFATKSKKVVTELRAARVQQWVLEWLLFFPCLFQSASPPLAGLFDSAFIGKRRC
jgi:hypothetical protein